MLKEPTQGYWNAPPNYSPIEEVLVPGKFVISLDMELMWGVRDKASKEQYGQNVLGEREAIPAILDLFERHGIHATWAVVGMAMCDGVDELLTRAPMLRPTYTDPSRSTYSYLNEAGPSERQDPYFFAPTMVRKIASCPDQEICTHTFSHYYCLEPGQTAEQFDADIAAACQQFEDWGLQCRSIVFPRNQYRQAHLDICAARGVTVYRGNASSWLYQPLAVDEEMRVRRLGRLMDAYLPITGANASAPETDGAGRVNVPSSRFLRPYSRKLKALDGLRLRRILSSMSQAASGGAVYHLWWHPHNFGANTNDNVRFLDQVLQHYRTLRDSSGMESATMAEVAAAA